MGFLHFNSDVSQTGAYGGLPVDRRIEAVILYFTLSVTNGVSVLIKCFKLYHKSSYFKFPFGDLLHYFEHPFFSIENALTELNPVLILL